jgi:Na+/H+-translocating membrane pyrophosphatase
MSIGMLLISVELFLMLMILLFIPGDYAGSCFIGFAIGESLGAAALRIAGGIFTKIADIGADLMKIVFNVKEDDVRNPGVIADCTGDNAGDSVGPIADGETFDLVVSDQTMPGMTGVEFAAAVRGMPNAPAVAIYTGYGEGLAMDDLERVGVAALLRKPIEPPALVDLLGRVLRAAAPA